MASEIASLELILDEGFNKRAWHGPNLLGALRGLSVRELLFRPQRRGHNIWELAVHCAYWKYAVRNQLLEGKRNSFPLPGSNFFPRNAPLALAAWKRDLALLRREHATLRAAVLSIDVKALDRQIKNSKHTVRRTVLGVAAHDIYHAGQIGLLKRLAAQSRVRPGAEKSASTKKPSST